MDKNSSTTLLCVLDGFGLNPNSDSNAVTLAKKPNFDRIFSTSPATTLTTFGERVGLPEGQMGNSEVGHLNIGGGRVIEQWLLRISRALRGSYLDTSTEYRGFISNLAPEGTLHLVGLYSDGGVHSHCDHLLLLLHRIRRDYHGPIALHVITDGRDTQPKSSLELVKKLDEHIAEDESCSIATVSGRFFAMDRDKRWDRVEKAYVTIARAKGPTAPSAAEWIRQSYEQGNTDEFIEPAVITPHPVKEGDSVLFWNFREDRMREIVGALCIDSFSGFARGKPPFSAERTLGFTEYDHTFHVPYLFPQLEIRNHLGEVISSHGLTQLRVAETEKYPHVTYFLNGGIEKEYPGEHRALVPSPRDVKTYDQKPEMSAAAVTDIVVDALRERKYSFIVVNLANCDMVGHTGALAAATSAVETVDKCLGRMLEAVDAVGGVAVILADHGNAEQMIHYEDRSPHTAHTTYPVPFIIYGRPKGLTLRKDGALCDVAPTVLKLMNIPQPIEMTGEPLF